MSDSGRPLRAITLIACATIAASIVGMGGCSHSTSTVPGVVHTPTPTPSGSPTATPSPTPTANVFVSMEYASMPPTVDPVYGTVDGYALISPPPTPVSSPTPTPSPKPSPTPTQTPGPSSIITVGCNQNIQFLNFDSTQFRTASLLNPPTGPFPSLYNNQNTITPSFPLTPISFPQFSTGRVTPNIGVPGRSQVYNTGSVSGVYYFGDFYDYNSQPSMRTVIVVKGC
jgi:hypothetical protein